MLTGIAHHRTEQADLTNNGTCHQSDHHAKAFCWVCKPNFRGVDWYGLKYAGQHPRGLLSPHGVTIHC